MDPLQTKVQQLLSKHKNSDTENVAALASKIHNEDQFYALECIFKYQKSITIEKAVDLVLKINNEYQFIVLRDILRYQHGIKIKKAVKAAFPEENTEFTKKNESIHQKLVTLRKEVDLTLNINDVVGLALKINYRYQYHALNRIIEKKSVIMKEAVDLASDSPKPPKLPTIEKTLDTLSGYIKNFKNFLQKLQDFTYFLQTGGTNLDGDNESEEVSSNNNDEDDNSQGGASDSVYSIDNKESAETTNSTQTQESPFNDASPEESNISVEIKNETTSSEE